MGKALGTVGFRKRGAWTPNTWYRADDAVNFGRSLLYAKADHTSGSSFNVDLWGFIADARGVEEATVAAENAAELARLNGNAAARAAENAAEAAERANEIADIADIIKGSIKESDSDEFIYAITDAEGKVLFAIDFDGICLVNELGGPARFSQFESEEFIYALLDEGEHLLLGVGADGAVCIPKGIPDQQAALNGAFSRRIASLEALLAEGTGIKASPLLVGDEARIPIPDLAVVNLVIPVMPVAKSGLGTPGSTCDIPARLEFWDQQGNFLQLHALVSAQGNSSLAYVKKNLAVDLFSDSDWVAPFSIRFGDWVPQDSFHLKAYYTDAFRGVCVASYKLYEQMMRARGLDDDAPFKATLAAQFGAVAGDAPSAPEDTLLSGARCFPDGFPVVLFQNGEFYGIYSWQLKKHRDNYHMQKKEATHIHLDGELGSTALFGGTIDWSKFEVRNPKSLVTMAGEEYDGDRPAELIDVHSEAYVGSDKDMKRTVQVKQAIVDLSGRIAEFRAAEAEGKREAEMRELVSRYFDVPFCIDYLIFSQVVGNTDGFSKNWQWTTWDGVRWTPNPYDLDMSFGGHWIGNVITPPSTGWIGTSSSIPTGWIYKYFKPEIFARYGALRDAGIFDPDRIASLVADWQIRIGADLFEAEFERWPESPCHRPSNINSQYWKRVGEVTSKSNFLPGVELYNPEKDYKAGEQCYHGVQNFYLFECTDDCSAQPPVLEFYTQNPPELGYFDSPLRVLCWLKERIAALDALMGYVDGRAPISSDEISQIVNSDN